MMIDSSPHITQHWELRADRDLLLFCSLFFSCVGFLFPVTLKTFLSVILKLILSWEQSNFPIPLFFQHTDRWLSWGQ